MMVRNWMQADPMTIPSDMLVSEAKRLLSENALHALPVVDGGRLRGLVTRANLLPGGQLDGGHIVYSLASRHHRRISLVVGLGLVVLGVFCWPGWALWGMILLLLSLRFRHPPLVDRWEPLDPSRRTWAVVALVIFLLCFTPWPAMTP